MDIKLKKSKVIISFVSWFLGISILFFNILTAVSEYSRYGNFKEHIEEVLDGDYQNTLDFRYYMSDHLNTFLSMSVEGPLYNDTYETSYGYYDDGYGGSYGSEVAVATKTLAVEEAGYSGTAAEYAEATAAEPAEATAAEAREAGIKAAKEYNDNMQYDGNILYTVANAGKVLYTNEESLGLYDDDFVMPEGYNFLLYFDGSKVSAFKDGKEVDIYGDGYYKDDGDWYVPGYKNFTADETISESQICIAATQTPGVVVRKNYDGQGSNYYDNSCYSIQQNLYETKARYTLWLYTFAAAFIFLIISIILRREKKEANRKIAEATGKLWYEIKLIPVAGIIISIGAVILYIAYNWYYYWGYYRDYGENLWESGSVLSTISGTLVIAVWFILWLFINDMKYNKTPWKISLAATLKNLFQTAVLKHPAGKRMVKRSLWICAAETAAGCVLFVIFIFIAASSNYMSYSGMIVIVCFMGLIAAVVWMGEFYQIKMMKRTAQDMEVLVEQIELVHNGKLVQPLEAPRDSDLSEAIGNLNDIRKGMNTALEERMRSERMKVELIANVSHDIKTPLTSIISYVDILKQEDNLPEHIKEYVSILENKSQRLKAMVQDVFEVSKAASGELPMHMESLDLGKLLRQTLADMSERIEESMVTVKSEIPGQEIMIYADGERLYRVFQNLIQNSLNYSLAGSRVFVTLQRDGELAVASVKNTSKEELKEDFDFTERFARGDRSRSDGGSGLGLSIAQSFTEACGGTFKVETIADLFVVTVSFQETANTGEKAEESEIQE